jgi:hypothetical protein
MIDGDVRQQLGSFFDGGQIDPAFSEALSRGTHECGNIEPYRPAP